MPEAEIKKRGGAVRWRTIHPKGRKDVYFHVAVTKKKGPKGGKTVIGKEHHKGEKKSESVEVDLNMIEKLLKEYIVSKSRQNVVTKDSKEQVQFEGWIRSLAFDKVIDLIE